MSPGLCGAVVASSCALLLAACVSPTSRVAQPPAPPLQLLDTGSLEMPRGCEPLGGTMYRTSFVVQLDGRVADAASESGDGCVQSALRQWVSTFEYLPPREPTPTVIDWMQVTASRLPAPHSR
jgi:hypothetical protein